MLAATAARRKIVDCDNRIRKYRAALEAGAEPALVSRWLAEVQAERGRAEAQLRVAPPPEPLRRAELAEQVSEQARMLTRLQCADTADKAAIYAQLGLRMKYLPGQHRLLGNYQPGPCTTVRVRGGT